MISLSTRLSEDLNRLLKVAEGRPISMGQVLDSIQGRGLPVLMILMALPFAVPIPLPGLSTPIGLALMLFGICVVLNKPPFLPKWLLRREIPHKTMESIVHKITPVIQRFEKHLCNRWTLFQSNTMFRGLNGLAIISSGFVLMLPLPVPLTNFIPAVAIALIAAGMMEEDGIFIVMGYVMSVGSWAYLLLIYRLGRISAGMIWGG